MAFTVRAIHRYERRILRCLPAIHIPDLDLEIDVRFMYVLPALKIFPVIVANPLTAEAGFDELDWNVQKDVEVRLWQLELTVFGIDYPFAQFFSFSIRFKFCTLISYVGIHISVKQDGASFRKGLPDLIRRSMPVFSEKQSDQLRVDILY